MQRTARLAASSATTALGVALLASAPAWAGVQVAGEGDTSIKLGALVQTRAEVSAHGAPDGSAAADFYLRRMRLMLYGTVHPQVHFFVETDSPNFGKGGDWSGGMFIQDAWVEWAPHRALQLDAGLLLVPLSHNGTQSAASLVGLDYQSALVRYPDGAHKVWRDVGVMARGLVLQDRLEYRVALLRGVQGDSSPESVLSFDSAGNATTWQQPSDPRNDAGWPRLTARLVANLLDAEGGPGVGGFYTDGLYLEKTEDGLVSTRQVLAAGVGVDAQPGVNVTWDDPPVPGVPSRSVAERTPYSAVAGDVFAALPLDEGRHADLIGQVSAVWYDHGKRDGDETYYDTVASSSTSGVGAAAELAVRVDAVMPFATVEWFDATHRTGADLGDHTALRGGVKWLPRGNATALTLQGSAVKSGGAAWTPSAAAEVQLAL